MYLWYKTKYGRVGKVDDVNLLPKWLNKLIVKCYDGSRLTLPYSKKTIIDANMKSIADVVFNCDVLKIYNLGDELLIRTDSKIREIAHMDMRKVTDMSNALMCTSVTKICELDYNNVVFSYQLFCWSKLTGIPPMTNYRHLNSNIFDGTNIPIHKVRIWKKLMKINKK